ncbi:MAG: hypothetical protein J7J25_03395, partial [Candidatus Omnitrophica bacterium]|nr:hypothetical protein [Candidatus Omnitrophota bacterium]
EKGKGFKKKKKEVKEGDIIVAKQGLRKVLAIGRVFSKDGKVAYFSVEQGFERTRNKNNPHANFINVKWKIKNLTFEDRIFRIGRFGEIYNMVVKRHQKKYLPMIFKEIEALWKERYELLS